jgi:hypothetical protein
VQRPTISLFWSRLAPLSLLPGCLVAFNDYPLGELGVGGAAGASSGGAPAVVAGSSSTAGGVDTLPVATGGSGGTNATVPAGGTDAGGSSSMPSGGAADQLGGAAEVASAGAFASEVSPYVLDDFEDGDEAIYEHQGRRGTWFVLNDGTASQTPEPGSSVLPSAFQLVRSGSTRGMHTSGGPFDTWGASLGTTLASVNGEPSAYDLSMFQGLKFWVRSNTMSQSAAKEVRLSLLTTASGKVGSCTACFGITVPLTSKWVQIEVPFASITQGGFGRPGPSKADLQAITSLQFQFPDNVSFDFWLDDIELY